jgi:hemolysin III
MAGGDRVARMLSPHLADHYPTPASMRADLIVHVIGLGFAVIGGATLLVLALGLNGPVPAASVLVYVAAFVAMLALSAAYNFSKLRWRPVLRRLDHAAIFLMIAGSYTPFTTQRLHGDWAVGMTLAVWGLALAGAAAKLFLPGLGRGFWVVLYLGLGWIAVVAIKPILASVSWTTLALLAGGGLVYSIGAGFYVLKQLKFRRAIWHGHVVGAAALHFVAVLVGVVLAPSAG